MKKSKIWGCVLLCTVAVMLIFLGAITAVIDPCFHYHAPLRGFAYPLFDQRYQNDGIISNFDYDAMIIGTSMTENFKTSELNALFSVNAIKVPFSGATYKEIDNNLRKAVKENPDIKLVVRSLDGYMLTEDKNSMRTDAVYPEYLYDENVLNDVSYLFNKSILFQYTVKVMQWTIAGMETTSFDEYSQWTDKYPFGPEAVLDGYQFRPYTGEMPRIDARKEETVRQNVLQNVVSLAKEHPEITFYYYFPPYSIAWWGNVVSDGKLGTQVDAYRIATEEILKCENIKLYAFVGEYPVVTDLNNYMDFEHHSGEINSMILENLHSGQGLLTAKNWEQYWNEVENYYGSFDYASYLENYGIKPEE